MAKDKTNRQSRKKTGARASNKKAASKKAASKKAASKKASATKEKTKKNGARTTKKGGERKKKTAAKPSAASPRARATASDNAAADNARATRNGGAAGHGAAAGGGPRKPTIPAPPDLVVDQPGYGRFTEEELRRVKTRLTRKDLQHFREMLLEKRAEIIGDVEGMEQARHSGSEGNGSHMPLHMADVGSDQYEQEFTLGLMESERKLVREIDEALIRIENGTYGVCIESGKAIPKSRLRIRPWARHTIEVTRDRERRGRE